jgi:alpha-1,3-rhamnosyl/mannosyltransferase
MRILIDATPLLLPAAGVKSFIYHWIIHLKQRAGPGDTVSAFPVLRVLGNLDHTKSNCGRLTTLVRVAFVNFTNIRGNRALDLLVKDWCDVFHVSQHLVNPPRGQRITATIYDMTCWLMPEMHTPQNVAATKLYAERVLKRADRLIAISESTRNDAVRILGLREESIDVIYPGVPENFGTARGDIHRLRHEFRFVRPYVLFVGCVEPRKNVAKLLDAWQKLPRSVRADHELVIAGPLGWNSGAVAKRLLQPEAGIRYLGYVAEQDLPGLIAGATAFVYPSFYEGFGFPVAQAMAAGTPVITSNVSSLPEVAGNAALLVDPHRAEEIRDAVLQILLSPALAQRLRTQGIQRAQQYHWDVCASKSLTFFHRVLNR